MKVRNNCKSLVFKTELYFFCVAVAIWANTN